MHSFWGYMKILVMDVEGLSKNFGKFGQHSCSLTKQCNLFQHVCICEKDVAKLSRSLEKPWNLNVLQVNNGFIFKMHGNVQKMSKDYQGTLKDLSKTHVVEQMMHALRACMEMSKGCWKTIKECWRTLIKFMFLNQTIHALWTHMDMLNEC